jgi:uncharacterized protein (TIGR00290 family)
MMHLAKNHALRSQPVANPIQQHILNVVSRVALSWSSGKDSAWALHLLRQSPGIEVVALITTFNQAFDRVAMHAVRRELVERQAELIGLPMWPVDLPWPCTNEIYESKMSIVCQRALAEQVDAIAFGDLFLRDIRAYRERQLEATGLKPIFPLWEIPTADLASQMIVAGLKAKITCVDPRKLNRSFAGRDFDPKFLADLPLHIDPCGENGEFHTFVSNCPDFAHPIQVETGEIVDRDGFTFADVVPTSKSPGPPANPLTEPASSPPEPPAAS